MAGIADIYPPGSKTQNGDKLFRGVPGFPDGGPQGMLSQNDLMPLNTNKLASVTEYGLVALCTLLVLFLLYWLGVVYQQKRQNRKRFDTHNKSVVRYMDLQGREETIQSDIQSAIDQLRSVSFLMKCGVTIYFLLGLVLYRMGPSYLAYTVKEMPHMTVTIPLLIIVLIYLWKQRLSSRQEQLLHEKRDLEKEMRDQEMHLRQNMDQRQYNMYKRMVLQEEKAEVERLRSHQLGCTEKCRVKNCFLEMDLQRNHALADKFIHFNWCDICAGSQSSLSPPSGSQKGFVACTSACGMRLLRACRPLMTSYGEKQDRIDELTKRFESLEQREATFREYKEQQQKFKSAERQIKHQRSRSWEEDNMRQMLGLDNLTEKNSEGQQNEILAEPQDVADLGSVGSKD